jgi:hypothetical protein
MTDTFNPFSELDFHGEGEYPTAEALTTVNDLLEQNVWVRRWRANGGSLKLRIRALDLEQQDRINFGKFVQHPKTKAWLESHAAYCTLTLFEGIIAPKLTPEQAHSMRRRNPIIMGQLADYIWLLAALTEEAIERYAATPDDVYVPDDAQGLADEPLA